MSAPLVSIVTATYDRSNVLGYAIRSVLRSTLPDWELRVIGDACTDDTAEVVAAFGDSRVSFHNLEVNFGEQSRPNNVGVQRSTGRYVAFLNHDDMWLPEHLEALTGLLERQGLDLAYSLHLSVSHRGELQLGGVTPARGYDIGVQAPASSWVLRRSLVKGIGPWPSFRECWDGPSQTWLRRAYRAGARVGFLPRVTLVTLPSGKRVGSYTNRDQSEHAFWWERMQAPGFRSEALTEAFLAHERSRKSGVASHLFEAAWNLARNGAVRLGIPPGQVRAAVQYRRRGALLQKLRRNRGLPPIE